MKPAFVRASLSTFASAFGIAGTFALVTACSSCASTPAPAPSQVPPAAVPTGASATDSTATTTATTVPSATSEKLRAAVAGEARTDKERARDGARHPAETLSFIGLREDAAVLELWPGGGYYTAILAPVLADRGKLIVTHADPKGDPKSEGTRDAQNLFDRFAKGPKVFGKVTGQLIATPNVDLGQSASVDFVLTFRNVHNWIEGGYAEKVFSEAFRVLKPGGVLGVEEHRGKPGLTLDAIKESGYVPESVVQHLAEQAGFRLAARSEVNANPKDTKDYPNGVWSLPPSLAGKDVDRAKYVAIGESDRMTLRFVKP
ncbi:MAG TPA: methyltransferase domain-containing protein [Polyangiaceae bacterium]|nr:methyltransferase domain-containing protein [Polyangiaceae bacterium]